MKTIYVNRQDESDPMNFTAIMSSDELINVLNVRQENVPFVVELSADNGYQLTVGVGGSLSFAQYRRTDGELPYLVALPSQARTNAKYVEFLINNTPTAIPAHYILAFDEMKKIAIHFFETGERSRAFSWKSI